MNDRPVYLDHNATTPVDPRVFAVMQPYFCEIFGNAASRLHSFGQRAAQAVETARAQVAALIHADPHEIIFTSGSTEANNLALKGAADFYAPQGKHIITQATEHKAILDPCKRLESMGYQVTTLGVDRTGRISLDEFTAALRPDTILVSIMYANNETGTLQPIAEIGRICRAKKILFHTDATQAVGHIPVDVQTDQIDLLSLSAHKLYGPKGVGALYVRKHNPRIRLTPQLDGGGHERGFRSGTLNVPGIVGFGEACRIAQEQMPVEARRLAQLRDHLEAGIFAANKFISLNGHRTLRLPHTSNLSFAYVEGESLMLAMDDIAVSSGSACTSASLDPSHVLSAMGVGAVQAHSSIRFGLGRSTTLAQVDYVIAKLTSSLQRLRDISPLYEMAQEGINPETVHWNPTAHQTGTNPKPNP